MENKQKPEIGNKVKLLAHLVGHEGVITSEVYSSVLNKHFYTVRLNDAVASIVPEDELEILDATRGRIYRNGWVIYENN